MSGNQTARILLLRLSHALASCDSAAGLVGDLKHDVLSLLFRDVLHKDVVGLLEFRVAVNLIHDAIPHPLLTVDLLDFMKDDHAFQAFFR